MRELLVWSPDDLAVYQTKCSSQFGVPSFYKDSDLHSVSEARPPSGRGV